VDDESTTLQENAAAEARNAPLELLNPARDDLFAADAMWPVFDRLRDEDPVHFTAESGYGPYWSITRYNDIVEVDSNHQVFSSAQGTALLSLESQAQSRPIARRNFMDMDPPQHDEQRKTVTPAVASANLAKLAPLIRERAGVILDSLPIGVEFDWVDLVSKELTSMTLATLIDYPFEERRKLTFWSDVLTNSPGHGPVTSWEQKRTELAAFHETFARLRQERARAEPSFDLISMLAHGEATRDLDPEQYLMNVSLLIIGGNDTTRNTISGSIYALNRFSEEYRKLRENPALVPSMVSESIRWQTPVAHMARNATCDHEIGGKTIRAGDRVVMWYVSGNRDERMIAEPYRYLIDRERPRMHVAFGFGVHRCVGNRLAELQLTIIWEEILKRFPEVIVTGEPQRTYSIRFKGYETMPVVIPRRN
jgi:cytochrome P450